MIRRYQENILSYFETPIDNDAVEALNNKAQSISHRAFDYRTASTFKRALYHMAWKSSPCQYWPANSCEKPIVFECVLFEYIFQSVKLNERKCFPDSLFGIAAPILLFY
jgi:hypothetical protein